MKRYRVRSVEVPHYWLVTTGGREAYTMPNKSFNNIGAARSAITARCNHVWHKDHRATVTAWVIIEYEETEVRTMSYFTDAPKATVKKKLKGVDARDIVKMKQMGLFE